MTLNSLKLKALCRVILVLAATSRNSLELMEQIEAMNSSIAIVLRRIQEKRSESNFRNGSFFILIRFLSWVHDHFANNSFKYIGPDIPLEFNLIFLFFSRCKFH